MLRAIETTVVVDEDGTARLRFPPDLKPGEYRVVLVIEEEPAAREAGWRGMRPYDIGLVNPNETFRREDLYGDGDR